MVEMVENGMVVGVAEEWERLNAETPYDKAGFPQMESYLWDTGRVHEVVGMICGLEDGDVTEEVAQLIYDHLTGDEIRSRTLDWFRRVDANDYNAWMNGRC